MKEEAFFICRKLIYVGLFLYTIWHNCITSNKRCDYFMRVKFSHEQVWIMKNDTKRYMEVIKRDTLMS